MHLLDMFILVSIGQVVAWTVTMYENDNDLRLIGHIAATTVGALVGGYLSLHLYSQSNKFSMIFVGFIGAGLLLYLVRFRRWR